MPVRDDLRALEGYHSAAGRRRRPAEHQRVAVPAARRRGATSSPPSWPTSTGTAIPTAAATSLRAAIAEWHGVRPDQVFAANGSNEVLQTLLLAYAGPGRTVVTFEPTYQLHAHIARITGATVVEGERRADFTLDADAAARRRQRRRAGRHVPVLAEQPDRPRRGPGDRAPACSPSAPGLVVVDEAYAQFADWSALDLVDDDVPLAVVRTFSKTWSMAGGPARLPRRPDRGSSPTLEKVVLPYHLDAAKQIAGRLALGHVDEMDAAGQADRRRARAARRRSSPRSPVDVVPERRQLRAVPAAPAPTATTVWQAPASTAACWSATARAGRASTAACGSRSARPSENDRFLDGPARTVLGTVSRT